MTPSTTHVPVEAGEWKLVPVKATKAMVQAGVSALKNAPMFAHPEAAFRKMELRYTAMLAAAPQPVQGIEAEELARLIRAAVGKLGDVIWSLAKGTGTEAEATQWEVRTANEILAILSHLPPSIVGEGVTDRDRWLSDNGAAILEVLRYGEERLTMLHCSPGIELNYGRERARHDAIREVFGRYAKLVATQSPDLTKKEGS